MPGPQKVEPGGDMAAINISLFSEDLHLMCMTNGLYCCVCRRLSSTLSCGLRLTPLLLIKGKKAT